MTWLGPALDAEQMDLARMIDAFAHARATAPSDFEGSDDLIPALAELGVWTLGATEQSGGGGADDLTATVAMERLGRHWPALGWASAQAHAAVAVLCASDQHQELVAGIHAGTTRIAVVDASSIQVHIDRSREGLRGTVDRVDAAGAEPHLLILMEDSTAVLISPCDMTATPVQRCGLSGAQTTWLELHAPAVTAEITAEPTEQTRGRLLTSAAAVAAGIAGAAHDAASDYAATRRQFGGPLTQLPTVRKALLDQELRISATLGAVVCAAADSRRALAAVRTSAHTAIDVAASAIQIHGGYGYLSEYPVERYLRDAISLRAAIDLRGAEVRALGKPGGRTSGPVSRDQLPFVVQ